MVVDCGGYHMQQIPDTILLIDVRCNWPPSLIYVNFVQLNYKLQLSRVTKILVILCFNLRKPHMGVVTHTFPYLSR